MLGGFIALFEPTLRGHHWCLIQISLKNDHHLAVVVPFGDFCFMSPNQQSLTGEIL